MIQHRYCVKISIDWTNYIGARDNEGAQREEREGAATNVTDSSASQSEPATIVVNEGTINVENNALTCNHSTSNAGSSKQHNKSVMGLQDHVSVVYFNVRS